MITTICKLKFKDGAEVTARIDEKSFLGKEKVEYTGAIKRLTNPRRLTDSAILMAYFRQEAEDLHAELIIDQFGEEEEVY